VAGGNASNILQQALLPVADDRQCQIINGYPLNMRVDSKTMLCAGGRGSAGGCQGDSGGPFVCNEGGKWVLRGAVSWGHIECSTDYYSVFTRISEHVTFINAIVACE